MAQLGGRPEVVKEIGQLGGICPAPFFSEAGWNLLTRERQREIDRQLKEHRPKVLLVFPDARIWRVVAEKQGVGDKLRNWEKSPAIADLPFLEEKLDEQLDGGDAVVVDSQRSEWWSAVRCAGQGEQRDHGRRRHRRVRRRCARARPGRPL